MNYVFKKISMYGKKTGFCNICGKRSSRIKLFFQTINPFNLNKNGEIKSEKEIFEDLKKEIKEWEKIPFIHFKCEKNKEI